MLWEGNRQIQEYTDQFIFTTVYDQDSFEPVSRLVQDRQDTSQIKVYHYHNNHLGTPQELTDENGEVVWCNYEWAWGGRYTHHYTSQSLNGCAIIESDLQPIRFQGQYHDIETGLHYNRFRYYDSDVGMFIQRDPIRLLVGVNVFQYAPNPIGWIDPWGLKVVVDKELQSYVNNLMKSPTFKNMYDSLDNENTFINFRIKDDYDSNINAGKYNPLLRNVLVDRTDLGKNGLYYFDKNNKACLSCKMSVEQVIAHEFAHAYVFYYNNDASESYAIGMENKVMRELNPSFVERYGHKMTFNPSKYR